MSGLLRRCVAEAIGTAILVLFGCGAAVIGGPHVGLLGIAVAFDAAIVALSYGLGPISGGHVNPAVSLAMAIAGRMGWGEMLAYWTAQVLGALAGAIVLAWIVGGTSSGLGSNGWGPGH